jgi:hypothetical protein
VYVGKKSPVRQLYVVRSANAELTDRFPIYNNRYSHRPILTTLCTERNEVVVAIGIVIVDAEEKRIVEMVRVLALIS